MDNNYSGRFDMKPVNVDDQIQDAKINIDRYAGRLNQALWGFLLLAVCTIIVGCLNLYFARDFLVWPLASGSGIWCGVLVAVSSIIGIVLFKSDFKDIKDIKRWKCWFWVYYGFCIANITIGAYHTIWSALSLRWCATGTCSAQAQESVIVSFAFSTAFGLAIFIGASIQVVVNMKLRKHVRNITPTSRKQKHDNK